MILIEKRSLIPIEWYWHSFILIDAHWKKILICIEGHRYVLKATDMYWKALTLIERHWYVLNLQKYWYSLNSIEKIIGSFFAYTHTGQKYPNNSKKWFNNRIILTTSDQNLMNYSSLDLSWQNAYDCSVLTSLGSMDQKLYADV